MAHDPARTTDDINRERIDFEFLRNKLKLKNINERNKFSGRHQKANNFLKNKGLDLGRVREHSAKVIGAGVVAGALLLTSPSNTKFLPDPNQIVEKLKAKVFASEGKDTSSLLTDILKSVLPQKVGPLDKKEEVFLEKIFQSVLGVSTKAALEGEHLNTTYGYIGAEQHLRRFPGDNMAFHPTVPEDDEGMAPGLGAWGYFAYSKSELTPGLVETEKWYAVVQTLYLPDWNKRHPYLVKWYKYRKVLIVNTLNGNSVVAAIADAGPAVWTGKHFGGSPEVMNYLGGPRYKKGPVILFFVDDPEEKVPLGPIDYTKINLAEISLREV
jgi:hypothetical protein